MAPMYRYLDFIYHSTMQQQSTSSTFTSEDNLCGVDLLGLVARGHIILTEILTLSERIPPAFVAAAAASASAAAADEATSSANKRATSSAASSYVWSLFGGRVSSKMRQSRMAMTREFTRSSCSIFATCAIRRNANGPSGQQRQHPGDWRQTL